jgi:glycosyltransferase involved in cell wall biosynthesis
MTTGPLPRLLIFSEGALSLSHGTGTIFARNFSAYPPDRLANWFIGLAEEPFITRHLDLNPRRWPARGWWPPAVPLAKLWNRTAARVTGRAWSVPVNRNALRAAAAACGGSFDIIYAIVYSRTGLDALQAVHAGLGPRLPLVLQIQDFFPHGDLGFWRALRRLAPHVTEVWAVSDSIARAVRHHLGRPVLVDPLFHLELPAASKQEHRPFTADFRAVVLGNFWQAALLDDLKAIWRAARAQLPELPPVRWHCHPAGIQRVHAAGLEPRPEVEPAPFLTGEALFAMLRDADLALIPFSRGRRPATDYERFSMPSRLTEICAAGLPVFGLTGDDTPLADYLATHGLGRFAPAAETATAAAALTGLMRDHAARASYGRAARALAERQFPLAPFQEWLHGRLRQLATPTAHR